MYARLVLPLANTATGGQHHGTIRTRSGGEGETAWNAGRKLGAKRALKPQQVWVIRFWLDSKKRMRDRAMFDLAINSKLRGCDIVKIKIGDIVLGSRVHCRAIVVQQKSKRPVQFGLLDHAQGSLRAWLERRGGAVTDYVFPPRNITDLVDVVP